MKNEKPYIKRTKVITEHEYNHDYGDGYIKCTRVITEYEYNPNYGDDRVCKCGHPYYRHFDTYKHMKTIGCKYCGCFIFEEEKEGTITWFKEVKNG
jgi:hypothetical protein